MTTPIHEGRPLPLREPFTHGDHLGRAFFLDPVTLDSERPRRVKLTNLKVLQIKVA